MFMQNRKSQDFVHTIKGDFPIWTAPLTILVATMIPSCCLKRARKLINCPIPALLLQTPAVRENFVLLRWVMSTVTTRTVVATTIWPPISSHRMNRYLKFALLLQQNSSFSLEWPRQVTGPLLPSVSRAKYRNRLWHQSNTINLVICSLFPQHPEQHPNYWCGSN